MVFGKGGLLVTLASTDGSHPPTPVYNKLSCLSMGCTIRAARINGYLSLERPFHGQIQTKTYGGDISRPVLTGKRIIWGFSAILNESTLNC